MSSPTPVKIMLDDRLRLISSALAATDYPAKAQERKRHHAHAHARAAIKHLQDRNMTQHPAIVNLQEMLNQGVPIEALFTLGMFFAKSTLEAPVLPEWVPDGWNQQLLDFYQKSEIQLLWDAADKSWQSSLSESDRVFTDKVYFKELLEQFVGKIDEDFVFVPNLLWPANREVGIRVENQLISIVPPPLAWGESPPWPYDEETRLAEHTYPMALAQYARLLMLNYLRVHADELSDATQKDLPISDELKVQYPTWEDQFLALFQSAVVAIYLEDYINPTESKGFMLMEKRVRKMNELPGTVSVLRRFLQEKGNRYNTLAEFLTVFPTQLRVAKKIVTL
ncbi:MAG: hypothetical protein WBC91_03890 [Phototrophicaceae bacterium]